MDLERCSCCLTYKHDDEINVKDVDFAEHIFTVCKVCDESKAVPGYVANEYWNKIYDGKVQNTKEVLDRNTVYFKGNYIKLREYFTKTKSF